MKKNLALAALVAVSVAGYAPSAHAAELNWGNLVGFVGGVIENVAPEYSDEFNSAVEKVDPGFVEKFDEKAQEVQTKLEEANQELQGKDKEELEEEVLGKFEEVFEQVVKDPNKREEIMDAVGEAAGNLFDQIVKPEQDGSVEQAPVTKEDVTSFFEKLAEQWQAVDKKQLVADIKAGAEKVFDKVIGQLELQGVEVDKEQLKADIKAGLATLAGKLKDGMTEEQVKQEFANVVNGIVGKLEGVTQDKIEEVKGQLAAGLKDVFDKAKTEAQAAKDKVDAYHNKVAKDAVDAAKQEIEQKYDAQIARLDNRITRLEDRVDKVGAMAAAMASLKTMGYDPAAPTEIAVGLGQYRDQTGIAVGAFHYPNKNFMLNMSVTTAGDEVMGGIGATWKIGRKK